MMPELSVNIDHVATVRQARRTFEPDPIQAAQEAQLGGADGITVHLREDRRHIQDEDVHRLKEIVEVKLNFEMAATAEMVSIARKIRPDMAMLVPEGRLEITTEGGLDVLGAQDHLRDTVNRLKDGGMGVSAFIDPDKAQIEAAAKCGFQVCEVHTGPYAEAFHNTQGDFESAELKKAIEDVREAGKLIIAHNMQFNAGHALNYQNVKLLSGLPGLKELHIGHSIVSNSIFMGMQEAVREMSRLIKEGSRYGLGA